MQAKIQETYNAATELYGRARAILDEHDGKAMGQEKANEVDTLFAEFDAKIAQAKQMEKALEREGIMREYAEPQNNLDAPKAAPSSAPASEPQTDEQKLALTAWNRALRGGTRVLSGGELKALRADSDPAGGYLVAPQQIVNQLIQAIDDQVFIRQLATVYPLERSESLGVPVLDTDLTDPDWTSELATGSEDSVEPFNSRELKPNPLAKRLKISRKLLRQSTINVDALVRKRLAYKFAVAQEKGFLTGTGTGQPLGVFTASSQGISTSRDVTAAGASAVAGDDFINTKFSLKGAYWNKARWILHRDVLKACRKLKDSQNNYIWSPGLGPGGGLTGGLPATLVDTPYLMSEYAPSTITTGLYTAIIGDFSYYWIAEALNLEIQVVMELYAVTNQVGYIGRLEVDGMPTHEEAFARLKQA
jgi:HK97 family phage major capsid protein